MCASALSEGHGAVWVGRWICEPPPYTFPCFLFGITTTRLFSLTFGLMS